MSALLLIIALFSATTNYSERVKPSDDAADRPPVAVVFTGSMDRVFKGLDLLINDEVDVLFISGMSDQNTSATRAMARYLARRGLSLQDLGKSRIVLSDKAQNTLQNAIDTHCWLKRNKITGPIVLITSESHMPRSSFATEQALRGRDIKRVPVPERKNRSLKSIPFQEEFHKFVATILITQLPIEMWNLFSPKPAVTCS